MAKGIGYNTYSEELIKGRYTTLIFGHYVERHNHVFWEMTVSLRGTYINHFDSGDMTISANSLAIIRPDDIHYVDLKDSDAVYRDIYMSDSEMREYCNFIKPSLYDEIRNGKVPPVISLDPSTVTTVDSYAFFLQQNKNNMEQSDIEAIRKTIICLLLGAYAKANILLANKIPDWINEIMLRLEVSSITKIENLDLSIEEIVKKTNYSHGHVCREFKKYTGKSLIQYINEQKLIYSTFFLSNPEVSITQVSLMMGYSNHSNYINAFKKQYGISPSQWRKNNIQKKSKRKNG